MAVFSVWLLMGLVFGSMCFVRILVFLIPCCWSFDDEAWRFPIILMTTMVLMATICSVDVGVFVYVVAAML